MFGISGTELALIVVFILIIFGPDKLPELARTLGKAMRVFKTAQEDMERVIKAEMYMSESESAKPAAETGPSKAAAASQAAAIWEATESDDEEEDEE